MDDGLWACRRAAARPPPSRPGAVVSPPLPLPACHLPASGADGQAGQGLHCRWHPLRDVHQASSGGLRAGGGAASTAPRFPAFAPRHNTWARAIACAATCSLPRLVPRHCCAAAGSPAAGRATSSAPTAASPTTPCPAPGRLVCTPPRCAGGTTGARCGCGLIGWLKQLHLRWGSRQGTVLRSGRRPTCATCLHAPRMAGGRRAQHQRHRRQV